MVRQSCRHRGCTRPPLLGRAIPLGRHRLSQGLPQTSVRQHEIVVNMGQCQLVPQARLTLAQRAGTPSNRRDVLTQTEVEALHQGGVDGPTQRTPYLIDGLKRAKDHTVRDVDSSPTPRGLDHLRIEHLRPGHPARLGPRPCGLTPRRLHPAPIVR